MKESCLPYSFLIRIFKHKNSKNICTFSLIQIHCGIQAKLYLSFCKVCFLHQECLSFLHILFRDCKLTWIGILSEESKQDEWVCYRIMNCFKMCWFFFFSWSTIQAIIFNSWLLALFLFNRGRFLLGIDSLVTNICLKY